MNGFNERDPRGSRTLTIAVIVFDNNQTLLSTIKQVIQHPSESLNVIEQLS